ncbi:MAG: hypothetical protein HZA78_09815 [Candidatus Schekmanbacteria bacterium]|nr:hypothetical protein [Candidatus Schekmanbacteria bacterium]
MEKLKTKLLYWALGASGSLSGLLSVARCPGNGCNACLGCAGVGVSVILMMVMGKIRHKSNNS